MLFSIHWWIPLSWGRCSSAHFYGESLSQEEDAFQHSVVNHSIKRKTTLFVELHQKQLVNPSMWGRCLCNNSIEESLYERKCLGMTKCPAVEIKGECWNVNSNCRLQVTGRRGSRTSSHGSQLSGRSSVGRLLSSAVDWLESGTRIISERFAGGGIFRLRAPI